MRKVFQLDTNDVMPTAEEVLASQGMAGRKDIPARINDLLCSALELFGRLAEPKGVFEEWPIAEFGVVYDGKGLNDPEGPVPAIVSRADALALFVATMGDSLIAESSKLFAQGRAALGYMLDSVNTSGAERL
ncbi:MAG TPA: hypothetical protein VLL97_09660, partial [Acidobacteriota bacterium]|nr:hypothetical protein [Acidobacteriota bacterium]